MVIIISILSVIQLNAGSILYLYLYGWLGVTLREYRKKGSLYEGYDYATKWSKQKNKNRNNAKSTSRSGGENGRETTAAREDDEDADDSKKGWSLDIGSDDEDDAAVNPEGKLIPTPWSSGSFFRNLFELFFRREGREERVSTCGENRSNAGDGDGWCVQI
jgi:hypothetical protein